MKELLLFPFVPFVKWWRMLKADVRNGDWDLVGMDFAILFCLLVITAGIAAFVYALFTTWELAAIVAVICTVVLACIRLAKKQDEK